MKRINGEEIMVNTKLLMKKYKVSFEHALAIVALERVDYWNESNYERECNAETIRGYQNV